MTGWCTLRVGSRKQRLISDQTLTNLFLFLCVSASFICLPSSPLLRVSPGGWVFLLSPSTHFPSLMCLPLSLLILPLILFLFLSDLLLFCTFRPYIFTHPHDPRRSFLLSFTLRLPSLSSSFVQLTSPLLSLFIPPSTR